LDNKVFDITDARCNHEVLIQLFILRHSMSCTCPLHVILPATGYVGLMIRGSFFTNNKLRKKWEARNKAYIEAK